MSYAQAEPRYVCHRAANAIITEVDPLRVSTDALQAINQFLDEYLCLLLSSSQSLDLSRIKAAVLSLLPSSLGKNAIVEAELQVKSFTESLDTIDYEAYERTRYLDRPDEFPLARISAMLREECLEYCTLAEKNHQRHDSKTWKNQVAKSKSDVAVSPIVTVYITTIIEHLAEYILTAIAMTAEHQDTEYIRIREVYLALVDDIQVGRMFQKMSIRERLEKRAAVAGVQTKYALPSPAPSPVIPSKKPKTHVRDSATTTSTGVDTFTDYGFDDDDYDNENYSLPSSPPPGAAIPSLYSTTTNASNSQKARPTSIMTTSTTTNTINSTNSSGSKKGFRFFKREKRNSGALESGVTSPTQQQQQQPSKASTVSVYNPDSPAIDFEDLIRSGNTVRVSLTPNRLKSIEIMKDHTAADDDVSFRSKDADSIVNVRISTSSAPPSRPRRSDTSVLIDPHPPRASAEDARHRKLEPHKPFENPRTAPKPPVLRSIAPEGIKEEEEEEQQRPPPPRASKRAPQPPPERPSIMAAKRASAILPSIDVVAMQHQQQASSSEDLIRAANRNSIVRDKVLRFEQAKNSTEVTTADHKDKTLYLLRQDGNVQHKAAVFRPPRYVTPVDVAVQTEADQPSIPTVVVSTVENETGTTVRPVDQDSFSIGSSERGVVEGDEEWYVPDEDWEDDIAEQEHIIAEWLLGG